MKQARLIRAVYFLWLIVPVAIYVSFKAYGLPHVLSSTHSRTYAGQLSRVYSQCNYIGPYGRFEVHFPRNGHCDFLRLFKSRGARG